MRNRLLLSIVALALLGVGLIGSRWQAGVASAGWTAGDHPHAIEAGGLQRRYVVHVPRGYDPAAPQALVVALHGAGGSADDFLQWTGWSREADRSGFLVVALEGT